MTELIVALDGPRRQYDLMDKLNEIGVSWFKVGPQTLLTQDFLLSLTTGIPKLNIFLDLKLADTNETVKETVRRAVQQGVGAISTFTLPATEAAIEAADGKTKIWQVINLSDQDSSTFSRRRLGAHGVICSGYNADIFIGTGINVVVPGVRFPTGDTNGHVYVTDPSECYRKGVTHAVVGRPIWQAADPVSVAKKYMEALA